MSIAFDGEPVELGEISKTVWPNFSPDREGLLAEDDLLGQIKGMGKVSLLLDGAQIEMLDGAQIKEDGSSTLKGKYVDEPELGRGRGESAHAVYFGQIIFSSMADYERPELVAVKPYADDHRGVLHELAVNTTVNRAGNLVRAFEPLGVWRDEKGGYSLITRYEHPVISYDTVFWADRDESPEALTSTVLKKAIRISAFGLGLLHGLGFAHGDPQVKNLGSDNSKIRFIDLEEARLFPRNPDEPSFDEEETRQLIDLDWGIYIDSCFREPNNIEDVGEAMLDEYEAIVKSYHKGIRRMKPFRRGELPNNVLPTQRDITTLINKQIELALEFAEDLDRGY